MALRKFLGTFTAVLALGATSSAFAVPTLTITDGVTTITVTDGGVGDQCVNAGCVTFNGAVGAWTINVDTGLTKPILGTAALPHLDVNFQELYSGPGAGALTLLWSETGFSSGPGIFTSDIGGTRAAGITTVAYADFWSATNTINALTTALCSGSFNTTAYASTCTAPFAGSAGYSLTERIVLTATGQGQASGDHSLQLPEPASIALIGLGLLGIGLVRRRRS